MPHGGLYCIIIPDLILQEHITSSNRCGLIAPILETGKVDIVFAGHVHNYQRTYPLTFAPDNFGSQLVAGANNIRTGKTVNGRWTLDKDFNGKKNTKPNGVIYIVTGAGGQGII